VTSLDGLRTGSWVAPDAWTRRSRHISKINATLLFPLSRGKGGEGDRTWRNSYLKSPSPLLGKGPRVGEMNFVKTNAVVIVVTLVAALMGANASAQQPTPAALLNPNWCSDVPASPPPPNLEQHPGDWAVLWKRCMNNRSDILCAPLCQSAKDRWKQQKAGLLNQPRTFPTPNDQPQGPFPLPGGGSGYILPAQPAPNPSGQTSDGADAVSAALNCVLPLDCHFGT
jgi:hypothetical protein